MLKCRIQHGMGKLNKKKNKPQLEVVFVSNDFWSACYVNGQMVYEGDDVNCSDKLLKGIFNKLPIIRYKYIQVTEEQYNKHFESIGYPNTLETFYAKITSTEND